MSSVKILNAKRAVAVFMAVLMTILSLSYTSNKTDAANTRIQYYMFNAKTGAKVGDYYLDPLPSVDNSRAVIGEDERVIDWTKSGVVKIMSPNYYLGSGFVVGDHVIATAAHCVYDYFNGNAEKITKILLFNNNGNIALEATPVTTHVPTKFINAVNDGKYRTISDYALITVKDDLSAYACFDLGVPLDSFMNSNSVVTVTGFPATWGKPGEEVTVNTATKHMMYSGNGKMYNGNDSLIRYETDTTGGNSGGPVYITESIPGRNTYYTVVAINIAEPNVDNPKYNIGTRMTTDLIHFYSANNTNIKWE